MDHRHLSTDYSSSSAFEHYRWNQISIKYQLLLLYHTYIHTYIHTYVRTYIHTYHMCTSDPNGLRISKRLKIVVKSGLEYKISTMYCYQVGQIIQVDHSSCAALKSPQPHTDIHVSCKTYLRHVDVS